MGPLQNESFEAVPILGLKGIGNREIVENQSQIPLFLYSEASSGYKTSVKC
jgi:hypothetical protein